MTLDPATLCARTAAGDAEMAAPRHGLAISQRRLLSFLDQPLGIDELGSRPGVTPERLERDLTRLVEGGLVEVHRPDVPTAPATRPPASRPSPAARPPTAGPAGRARPPSTAAFATSAPSVAAGSGAPVVIGRKVRRGRAFAVGFLSLAAAIAAVWYFAAPDTPGKPAAPAGPAPSQAAPGARVAIAPSAPSTALPADPVKALATAEPSPPQAIVSASALAAPSQLAAALPQDPRAAGAPEARRVAMVPSAPVPAPAPARAPAPNDTTRPAASAPTDPVPAAPAANPAPVRTPAPTATVPAAAPATPAPVQFAAAAPSTLEPRAQPRSLAPVSRESPAFPREALATGIEKGVVRARLSIDGSGRVTNVEIVESQPRRVFDRAVTRTLARWTYEPGAAGRTTDVEIAFNRD